MANVLYDRIGRGYAKYRRPDPRIASAIASALSGAQKVLNVGAGTGSYEPAAVWLVSVEPSAEMIRQRPATSALIVRGVAESLPFPDSSFDASIALLTIHHWADWKRGLLELKRCAVDRIVLFTWDPEHAGFWLVQDYFPEIVAMDADLFPSLHELESVLGPLAVQPVPIPADCTDGFLGAYWRRPERYLDREARGAISAFAKVSELESGLEELRRDLANGTWAERYRHILDLPALDVGYRLVIAERSNR